MKKYFYVVLMMISCVAYSQKLSTTNRTLKESVAIQNSATDSLRMQSRKKLENSAITSAKKESDTLAFDVINKENSLQTKNRKKTQKL